jgi:CRISPR-associated endonuclease/helicase Cas3
VTAVGAAGLESPPPASVCTFADLTGLTDATPSPLQALCQSLTVAEHPQIVIIEDATGSGKTEAALILANRMLFAGVAERLFIGLPTMATANAMFGRLQGAYRRLFTKGARPTLGLAHGRADLHKGFRAARIAGRQPEDAAEAGDGAGTASVLANTWLSDSRKKALLADVGVGTIDQALIGTLAARHQALRLLGVSGGLLVVDEVHAYDAYTGRLLAGLLTFQAALGGSAVVMSATLAAHQRRALLEAFAEGRGRTLPPEPEAADPAPYPLVTRWSEAEDVPVAERPTPPSGPSRPPRRLRCARLDDAEAAVRLLVDTTRAGGCGCWVRNTIADAREGFEAVRAHLPPDDVMLFHAAFIPADRQKVETRVLDTFGKGDRPGRTGKILVATQVVEQSLDVDFDAMVTDLAPVDLLIQRAGRQHRHDRGPRPDPVLHVLGPEAMEDPAEDWYARMFRAASHVYKDHGRLWLTQRLLTGPDAPPQGWDLIGDARHLIETVYGPDALDAVPPGLQESSCAAEGTEWADKNLADRARLRPERKYTIEGTPWEDDLSARTRQGDERVTLVLAVEGAGATLVPLSRVETPEAHAVASGFDRRRAWAESEVSLSASRVSAAAPLPPHLTQAAKALREEQRWPDERPLLVLLAPTEDGSGWIGEALKDTTAVPLMYWRESGLAYA